MKTVISCAISRVQREKERPDADGEPGDRDDPHGWMGLLVHIGGCTEEMPSVPADRGRAPKPTGQMVP